MKAIDLIIRLQQLPANMEVMIDITHDAEEAMGFHFVSLEFADEIQCVTGEKIIVLSKQNLDEA